MTDATTGDRAGLEGALTALEAEAIALLQALGAGVKAAKRAKAGAETGTVRDIPGMLTAAAEAARSTAEAAERLRASWSFEVEEWFSSGEYTRELLTLAAEAGVSAFESDDRILCYPAIVQVVASDMSVLIDKRREHGVRPSVVVGHLGRLQQRGPRFRPETFIESLANVYDLVVASKQMRPGAAAKLVDMYGVLTLMPGTAREYTKPEFARDIYLLDQSGIVTTKRGRTMSLPASALTRGSGVLRTVTRSGQSKDYAGISFEGASS